jgi:uncharacterized protein
MFDWNQGNVDHVAQHGVSPSEAEEVILNSPADLTFELRNGEERIAQVGETNAGRILVVVTTMRDELIRVVTAFPAPPRICKVYLTQRMSVHEGGIEESELQE